MRLLHWPLTLSRVPLINMATSEIFSEKVCRAKIWTQSSWFQKQICYALCYYDPTPAQWIEYSLPTLQPPGSIHGICKFFSGEFDVAVLVDSKIDVYRVDSESLMDYQTHQVLTSGKLELQILFWYWLSVTLALLKLCLEVKHQFNK